MEEETKVWKIVMLAICTAILTVSGCNGVINHQDNSAMVEMVAKGADPLDARCAIKGGGTDCTLRAASKLK